MQLKIGSSEEKLTFFTYNPVYFFQENKCKSKTTKTGELKVYITNSMLALFCVFGDNFWNVTGIVSACDLLTFTGCDFCPKIKLHAEFLQKV